jgi:hypothetical protein
MLSTTDPWTDYGNKVEKHKMSTQNATWEDNSVDSPRPGGLALLTQAMGLKRALNEGEDQSSNKVQRPSSPTLEDEPMTVVSSSTSLETEPSCPHLEKTIALLNNQVRPLGRS